MPTEQFNKMKKITSVKNFGLMEQHNIGIQLKLKAAFSYRMAAFFILKIMNEVSTVTVENIY